MKTEAEIKELLTELRGETPKTLITGVAISMQIFALEWVLEDKGKT